MRVAALYDIHGNLPALEAVLQDVRRAEVEAIVIGGDVIPGPMPHETLALLQSLDLPVHFIMGNGDREVLAHLRGEAAAAVPEGLRQIVSWVAEQLEPAEQALIADWPLTIRLPVEGIGEVLFCHATPRNDTEIFTRETAEEPLLPVFAGLDVRLVVCGHTHMQFDRMVGLVRVVNAGSVGMAYGEAGAYWLLLGPDVQLQRTSYDLNRAAERIRATDYPTAEEFAAKNVLQRPSEAEALAVFTPAGIK